MNWSSAEYPARKHRKRVEQNDIDLDIPDGDVEEGKRLFD